MAPHVGSAAADPELAHLPHVTPTRSPKGRKAVGLAGLRLRQSVAPRSSPPQFRGEGWARGGACLREHHPRGCSLLLSGRDARLRAPSPHRRAAGCCVGHAAPVPSSPQALWQLHCSSLPSAALPLPPTSTFLSRSSCPSLAASSFSSIPNSCAFCSRGSHSSCNLCLSICNSFSPSCSVRAASSPPPGGARPRGGVSHAARRQLGLGATRTLQSTACNCHRKRSAI